MPNASTDGPRITGFHHVALRVRDFDRSAAFYADVLGFKPRIAWNQPPRRAIMLDTGDGNYLELFERTDQAPPPAEEAAILHFALRTNDTAGLLERARDAGCKITMETKDVNIENHLPGVATSVPIRIAFFHGPDGEVVELFENELT